MYEQIVGGWIVSSAGDFNNDGYSDIIIGALWADPDGRSGAGTSYLLFGKATDFTDIDLSSDLVTNSVGFKVSIYIVTTIMAYKYSSKIRIVLYMI